ncbi:pentatricopeptide repeat-containing protein At5g66520-like [Actinidia eriantha]|uniref:pentatricopeptide repeat-containing protein At5g66520-like n=1 Tax=Actinidia eriantha TaxID=165200 RepID=UPI002587846A|nr:pentatricopeptide repeat-containing protein At5g66520-like [Actinidia eriantha]
MDMYVNRNCIEDAYFIFNEIRVKDVVAWTLMLTAFSSGQYCAKAIEHFNAMMRVEDLELDYVALTGTLKSCSSLGALHQGRGMMDPCISYTYANCANLEAARRLFEGMEKKDVACWNAMIAGNRMNSHAGTVDKGLDIFNHIIKTWNIVPSSRHYACVVDLLSRAGRLRDAYSLVNGMPFDPDFEVYCAVQIPCNIELGIEISNKLFQLDPNDAGLKDPGFGSIEINGELYTFMAGQKDHPQYYEVEGLLKRMIERIKEAGYVADTKSVLQELSDDVKFDILYRHSEKLAIAFGLGRTKPGTIIRITKNL